MKLSELEQDAKIDLEEDVKDFAISVLKSRIIEINKTEALLKRLKVKYSSLLDKNVDELMNEAENANIRF